MTTKEIRIMFYDENKRQWIVDTIEVEQDSEEQSGHTTGKNESHTRRSMAAPAGRGVTGATQPQADQHRARPVFCFDTTTGLFASDLQFVNSPFRA